MSRVQFIYAQAEAGGEYGASELTYPVCSFQSQLRKHPTFRKAGAEVTMAALQGGSGTPRAGHDGSWAAVSADFRAKLAAVGRRPFTEATLAGLIASHAPRSKGMEAALAPANAAWIKALAGRPLFDLLPEGSDFSGGDRVEVRVVFEAGQVVLLAQGPWFRVTFVETPLLQFLANFMTDYMIVNGDDGGEAWSREALMMFACTAHRVADDVLNNGKGDLMFMSGRRAPNAEFHLLQHMYLKQIWPNLNTSSLLAGRVFRKAGQPVQIAGTWAHEGPMAFMAMFGSILDLNVPASTILWTVLFWGCTGNHTILPDMAGSATYKCMLRDLGLLGDVSIARQDSGQLARFASIFAGHCPVMASEIETFADIESALAKGYVAFGAGGFFGEKRKTLGAEFSLAAKLTRATRKNADGTIVTGYSGKLGDFSNGSWAAYDPSADEKKAKQKFIASPDIDRDAMFAKLVGFAALGDAIHDAEKAGEPPKPVMRKADALALVAELERLTGAPSFALYPSIRDRLNVYSAKMAAATEKLA